MTKILILATALISFNLMAQTTLPTPDDLTLADEAIESPTMNLEGQYQVEAPVAAPQAPKAPVRRVAPPAPVVQRRVSASDRIKAYRERLEIRNRIMVEKKMEQIRYQQELALARQLERSMNQTLKAIDNVN